MLTITGLTFASSAAHFLRELGEPVGDEQRGVHEPLHAVGHGGLHSQVVRGAC